MGKRKAAKKPQGKKKNEPLATVFPCLFCNHELSVTCKLDKKAGVGQLSCKACSQQFQCSVNYLSAAVDVYAEWVDACDAVAKGDVADGGVDSAPNRASGRSSGGKRRNDEDDDEDDLINDEDDDLGYSGEGVAADDEY
ncbi:putative transcription elongation factor [Amylocarpus encephaloides]|uniref:Transcription elongation factor 1 homolog n=1 Tax=Amylocarpus encephaloides TaxID=45428 RepID=A0A9P7YH98_9HELO|nr:putative transcription elongation factor [Amylocarpus encephaloides]